MAVGGRSTTGAELKYLKQFEALTPRANHSHSVNVASIGSIQAFLNPRLADFNFLNYVIIYLFCLQYNC